MEHAVHYFVNSNGCAGFYSFFRSNFGGIESVYKLEDYPAPLTDQLFHSVIDLAKEKETKVEIVHNCLDNTVEGVILPQYRAAAVSIPAYVEDGFPVQKLIDDESVEQTRQHLLQAHTYFEEAKTIHDRWEKIYQDNTDYRLLDQYTKDLLAEILGAGEVQQRGKDVHRFFGAATESGPVDWIPELTAPLKKRYLIKGRPGTGKSTFLKKLAEQAMNQGHDTEIYHCGFDPASLDMVLIRSLDLCVFDSTAPHAYFPERDGDTVLDFYAAAVRSDTDERCRDALELCQLDYKNRMGKAKVEIAAANQIRLERESLIWREINREKAAQAQERLLQKLFHQNNI